MTSNEDFFPVDGVIRDKRYVMYRAELASGENLRDGPSLAQRAVNFAGAVVRHAADDLAKVDDAEQVRRIQLCKACDHYRPQTGTCSHHGCGCYVAIKVAWRSEKCPNGKW